MGLAGWALFAIAGAGFAATAVLLLGPPEWSIGPLVGDDAGYYFGIARNFCLGYGYSFDRLQETNGFNPLFPWLLVPLYRLLPPGLPLAACYRIGVLVDLIAMGVALIVYLRLVAAILDRAGWRADLHRLALGASATYFVLFIGVKANYGIDAPLVLAFGLLYLWRVYRRGPLAPGGRAAAIDGVLLALLFLARVDTLPLIAAAVAVMVVEAAARRGRLGALAWRLAVTAACCAPYLVWSTVRFGTWVPISAQIKSGFPVLDIGRSLTAIRHTSMNTVDQAAFLVAYLLAWGAVAWLGPRCLRALRSLTPLEPWSAALVVLALYLVGRLTYMLLFSRADVKGSYAILAHVFNVMVYASLIGVWLRRRGASEPGMRRLAAGASLALAVVAVGLFVGKVQTRMALGHPVVHGSPSIPALGREIHASTGDGDVLFGGSFGLLGFFADRPWINGDGVVNTYAYQRAFLEPGARGEGGLADYLRAHGVTHVAFLLDRDAPVGPEPIRIPARSLLYDRENTLDVLPGDILLRRPVPRGLPGGEIVVARWHP